MHRVFLHYLGKNKTHAANVKITTKDTRNTHNTIDCNLENCSLPELNSFWFKHFRHNWPSNDRLSFYLT